MVSGAEAKASSVSRLEEGGAERPALDGFLSKRGREQRGKIGGQLWLAAKRWKGGLDGVWGSRGSTPWRERRRHPAARRVAGAGDTHTELV
jgi:hypothetical protein